MEIKANINGRELKLDIYDLFWDAISQLDEFEKEEYFRNISFHDEILKQARILLESEFSRDNYNNRIHKERKKLLDNIKQNEVEYYADVIADKIDDCRRWQKAYYDIYHHVRDSEHWSDRFTKLPDVPDLDFDFRKELQEIIKKEFNIKIKED